MYGFFVVVHLFGSYSGTALPLREATTYCCAEMSPQAPFSNDPGLVSLQCICLNFMICKTYNLFVYFISWKTGLYHHTKITVVFCNLCFGIHFLLAFLWNFPLVKMCLTEHSAKIQETTTSARHQTDRAINI